jgi:hypothetical protein
MGRPEIVKLDSIRFLADTVIWLVCTTKSPKKCTQIEKGTQAEKAGCRRKYIEAYSHPRLKRKRKRGVETIGIEPPGLGSGLRSGLK